MSINFSAFEIGRRAINAHQLGIDVTGQNIANVNTPGYSRRSLSLGESPPSSFGKFAVGTGVSIQGIQAFRNSFIESRIQHETGIAGFLSARRDTLYPVQTALQGTDTSGIQVALGDFFGAFRELESNPDSQSLRSIVAGRAENLTNSFQSTYNRLSDIQRTTDQQLRATVNEVNGLSERIASLNIEIRKTENSGGQADALRDQRNEYVNDIAELTGARTTENDDGTINVTVGEGKPLVAADKVFSLTVQNTPVTGFAIVTFKGESASITDGTLKGYTSAIQTIGNQLSTLDDLAAEIANRVNAVHTSGTDANGAPGLEFFDVSVPVTVKTFKLNAAIANDVNLIVASPLAQPAENGTIAGRIANLLTDTTSNIGARTGSFSGVYGSLISEAGENVRQAEDGLLTQSAILSQATAQRESISGVSLDEEAINLLQYQKAFEAAARFIRVADEMTQTILSLAG